MPFGTLFLRFIKMSALLTKSFRGYKPYILEAFNGTKAAQSNSKENKYNIAGCKENKYIIAECERTNRV